jgi:hypothetical protein
MNIGTVKTFEPQVIDGAEDSNDPQQDWPEPVSIFNEFQAPDLNIDLLPTPIAEYAFEEADIMGADPAGLAMAALAVCAAALTDDIEVQVKKHNTHWRERAALWTMLVGDPSTRKSPVLRSAQWPLKAADDASYKQWCEAVKRWEQQPKDERGDKPALTRYLVYDTTVEALQTSLADNPRGVLCVQDELSGWFGAMDRYAGATKAAQRDRAVWLQAFNGGSMRVDRVGRGVTNVPNLSASIVGGIQPGPMRRFAKDGQEDGLMQRFLPILLKPSGVGEDRPTGDHYDAYIRLVNSLLSFGPPRPTPGAENNAFQFSDAAHAIRQELEQEHNDLAKLTSLSPRIAAAFGKWDGIFARLALLFHFIEADGAYPDMTISEDTAKRVRDFMHLFLRPHMVAFYMHTLGGGETWEHAQWIAGYILSGEKAHITPRDIGRAYRPLRDADRRDVEAVMDVLERIGWVSEATSTSGHRVTWTVNPKVHKRYRERAEQERQERQAVKAKLREMTIAG